MSEIRLRNDTGQPLDDVRLTGVDEPLSTGPLPPALPFFALPVADYPLYKRDVARARQLLLDLLDVGGAHGELRSLHRGRRARLDQHAQTEDEAVDRERDHPPRALLQRLVELLVEVGLREAVHVLVAFCPCHGDS